MQKLLYHVGSSVLLILFNFSSLSCLIPRQVCISDSTIHVETMDYFVCFGGEGKKNMSFLKSLIQNLFFCLLYDV